MFFSVKVRKNAMGITTVVNADDVSRANCLRYWVRGLAVVKESVSRMPSTGLVANNWASENTENDCYTFRHSNIACAYQLHNEERCDGN